MTESGAKFQQRSSHQQAVHRSRVITPNVTTMNFFKDLDRRGLFASTGVVTQKQTQLNGTLQEKSQLLFFFFLPILQTVTNTRFFKTSK
jgi:hypothetical protein